MEKVWTQYSHLPIEQMDPLQSDTKQLNTEQIEVTLLQLNILHITELASIPLLFRQFLSNTLQFEIRQALPGMFRG